MARRVQHTTAKLGFAAILLALAGCGDSGEDTGSTTGFDFDAISSGDDDEQDVPSDEPEDADDGAGEVGEPDDAGGENPEVGPEDAGPEASEEVDAGPCPDTCAEDYPEAPACAVPTWDPESCSCELVEADDGAPCETGDPCVAGDTCQDGFCVEGSVGASCDDGDACTKDTCAPGVGCQHEAKDCADEWACTEDGCDPAVGCTHDPLDGIPCDDGQECTTEDTCLDGICVGELDVLCPEFPCLGDPTRTLYADYLPAGGCSAFDGDEVSCALAWTAHGGAAAACYWKESGGGKPGSCLRCEEADAAAGKCVNACAAPGCDGDDPTWYLNEELGGCAFYSGDEAACGTAYAMDPSGNWTATCWYDGGTGQCGLCLPGEAAAEVCEPGCGTPKVSCPGDPSRYIDASALSNKGCSHFDDDSLLCNAAFEVQGDKVHGCYVQVTGGGDQKCKACDGGDTCVDACAAPPCADPSKLQYAGPAESAGCAAWPGTAAGCDEAYETQALGNLPVSCWWTGSACAPCAADDQLAGSCAQTCGGPIQTCPGDPLRTIALASAQGGDGCEVFDEDPVSCTSAFEISGAGTESCAYKVTTTGPICQACSSDGSTCPNTCDAPLCSTDATKAYYASSGCSQFDADPAACGVAYAAQSITYDLDACWFDAAAGSCKPCTAGAAGVGSCANTCLGSMPACTGDPGRTLLANDSAEGDCSSYHGDEGLCGKAFFQTNDGMTSCFYVEGGGGGKCKNCNGAAQSAGSCDNACEAPACGDDAKVWWVASCGELDGDPKCGLAWEGEEGTTAACGAGDGGACTACDGSACLDTCPL